MCDFFFLDHHDEVLECVDMFEFRDIYPFLYIFFAVFFTSLYIFYLDVIDYSETLASFIQERNQIANLSPSLKSATDEEIEKKFRIAKLYPSFFLPLSSLTPLLFIFTPLIYDMMINRKYEINCGYQYSISTFIHALVAPCLLAVIYISYGKFYIEKEIIEYNKKK